MLNLWVVALFAVVMLRDSLATVANASDAGGIGASSNGLSQASGDWAWAAAAGIVPLLAIALLVQIVMVAVARTLDRSGSVRALIVAERTLLASRVLTLMVHAGNVFLLGWLTQARQLLGDVVLLDELVCVLPALAVIVAGWWSAYPVERRAREAMILRRVEQGKAVYPVPSRWRYVGQTARHQLSLSLLPILLISAWGELGDRVIGRAMASGTSGVGVSGVGGWASEWFANPLHESLVRLALQVIGIAGVLVAAPLIVRTLWETAPLSAGPLRERLAAMCVRHRVRVREILVWRTDGSMINGAVVGMFGRMRYVLLTDALLDAMPRVQVEAVMAHEIAHARCSHMPWLGAVLVGAVGCTAAGGSLLADAAWSRLAGSGLIDATVQETRAFETSRVDRERAFAAPASEPDHAQDRQSGQRPTSASGLFAALGLEAAVTVGSLIAGLMAFGLVSRRFEWQADAFAAKALSVPPMRTMRDGGVGRGMIGSGAVVLHRVEDAEPAALDAIGSGGSSRVESPLLGDASSVSHVRAVGAPESFSDLGVTPDVDEVPIEPIVHRSAVDAMAGALQSVAALNYIPRHRRSFRHGSIAQRQQKLRTLVGRPLDNLPIDRSVRWIKRAAAIGLLVLAALAVWDVTR